MSSDTETHTQRLTGKVKWFNNKAGYGFITTNVDNIESDTFVHFSAINVTNSQYKYLVQGEYVEFARVKSTNGPHEYKATDITGINGGSLMCETRNTQQRPTTKKPRRREDEDKSAYDDGFTRVGGKKSNGPVGTTAEVDATGPN